MKITKKLLEAVRLECIRAQKNYNLDACHPGYCKARYECDCIRFFSRKTGAGYYPVRWSESSKKTILKKYKKYMKKKRKKLRKMHSALNTLWLEKKESER